MEFDDLRRRFVADVACSFRLYYISYFSLILRIYNDQIIYQVWRDVFLSNIFWTTASDFSPYLWIPRVHPVKHGDAQSHCVDRFFRFSSILCDDWHFRFLCFLQLISVLAFTFGISVLSFSHQSLILTCLQYLPHGYCVVITSSKLKFQIRECERRMRWWKEGRSFIIIFLISVENLFPRRRKSSCSWCDEPERDGERGCFSRRNRVKDEGILEERRREEIREEEPGNEIRKVGN